SFDGPLPKQIGAESVNGADLSFLELGNGSVQMLFGGWNGRRRGGLFAFEVGRRHVLGLFESFTKAKLQLARGLLGKRHADDFGNAGPAGLDDADDSIDELGCLAGASRRLDDERCIEIL